MSVNAGGMRPMQGGSFPNHLFPPTPPFLANGHIPPDVTFPKRGSPSTGRSVVSDISYGTTKSNKSQKGVKKPVWYDIPDLPHYESIEMFEDAKAWSVPEGFGVYPFKAIGGVRPNIRKKGCAVEGCPYIARAFGIQKLKGSPIYDDWRLQNCEGQSLHVHTSDSIEDIWNSKTGLIQAQKDDVDDILAQHNGKVTLSKVVDQLMLMTSYQKTDHFGNPVVMKVFTGRVKNYIQNHNRRNKRPHDETISATPFDNLIPYVNHAPSAISSRFENLEALRDYLRLPNRPTNNDTKDPLFF
jgi:hypothetical protein